MEKLTAQEEQAMQAIWNLKACFVKEILDNIKGEKMPYTTLASTVKNLEKRDSSNLLNMQMPIDMSPLFLKKITRKNLCTPLLEIISRIHTKRWCHSL